MKPTAESELAHSPTLVASREPLAGVDRLEAGARAGEYVVEGFLGAGAMGDVYAGRHPVIGKRVAIKVCKRELASEPEAAERFIREARAVNQIDHPNVIDVFGFGRLDDGRLYLIMDLVEGRSLRKVVQDGPLEVEAALDVLAQIADALDAAHARGVIHRDLKPDNVMLTDATPPKALVLDFGIAKLFTEGVVGNGTLTGKGTWIGTPGYMAPEQWAADGAGPASDRYALGVMAYELLSGVLPFQAATLPQMMEQHFRAPVPALSPLTLDPVLARAMAKSPEARFATARELVEALRAAAGGRRSPAAARPRALVPAAAGIAVLGLAIVGFVVIRSDSRSADHGSSDGDNPGGRANSADGFVRVQVITQPPNATVRRDDLLVGSSPATFEVRASTPLKIRISRPGYRPIERALTPGKDAVVREDLEAINTFEGVWAMPSGQLRAFHRVGDAVEVYKLETVTGEREFWRKLDLVDGARSEEVVFAITTELTDDRGEHDPSCQISHRIEYHFDPAADALDVRAERVETARQNGRCIVRTRLPGTPVALARADRAITDTRWTQPPVGRPLTPPVDDARAKKRALDQASKARAVRPPSQKLGNTKNLPAQVTKTPPAQQQQQQLPNLEPQGDSQQVSPQPIQRK
ncbi:MAG: serine/threonine protein kinase [Deltaproteobacteria bacterium]|nr:serine/threonine protein kinase [Deltaproteobacteria bacterium]